MPSQSVPLLLILISLWFFYWGRQFVTDVHIMFVTPGAWLGPVGLLLSGLGVGIMFGILWYLAKGKLQ